MSCLINLFLIVMCLYLNYFSFYIIFSIVGFEFWLFNKVYWEYLVFDYVVNEI